MLDFFFLIERLNKLQFARDDFFIVLFFLLFALYLYCLFFLGGGGGLFVMFGV